MAAMFVVGGKKQKRKWQKRKWQKKKWQTRKWQFKATIEHLFCEMPAYVSLAILRKIKTRL